MRNLSLTRRVLAVGGILLAIVVTAFVVMLVAIGNQRRASDEVRSSDQRIALATQIEGRVIDLETGLRGFVITRDPRFLEPYEQARQVLPGLRRSLISRQRQAGDAADLAPLSRVLGRLDSYVGDYLQPLISTVRRDPQAARTIVATGEGKQRVDEMRGLFDSIISSAKSEAEIQRREADSSASHAILVGILGLLGVPILIVIATLLMSRTVAAPVRRISKATERLRAGKLSVRVAEEGAGEVRTLAHGFNTMAESMQGSHDELEGAARLNEAVLETAQDAYVAADELSTVLVWTRQATELFGYRREEMLGRLFFDTCFPDIPREDFELLRRGFLARAEASGTTTQRIEVRARRKDGAPFRVELSASGLRSGDGWRINMFLRDVTGRTRRNEERRAEEAVSRVLAETERGEDLIAPIMAALGENLRWVHGGFWEYDERRGVLCSDRVWRAPDLDAPELDRMVREDFVFGPEDPNPRFSLWTGAWSSREVRWAPVSQEGPEGRLAREAGIRHAIAIPVQSGERMLGLLVFASRRGEPPQEERLQALRSIADLIGQVVERRNAELEAERMKNDFFALVSHELRTPLTSIVGYLDIVREEEAGEINDEQRRFLGVIDRNARRLQRLVGDLLFVAQVEAGTLALKSGEFDLGEVAGNAVDAARPRAEKQGVELRSDADSVTMVGDGDRLGQLVDNLVSNAIKFTPANGAVTVRLRGDGEEATLEVSDTGMGISSEDQAHLFNRFYRTDDAEKLAIPGIGLGLSICKAIVDGHGGSIAIESEEGAGTTFRVRLPVGGAPPGNGQPAGNGVRQVARR